MRRVRARLVVSSLCVRDLLERGLKSSVPLVAHGWCATSGCSDPVLAFVVVPSEGTCGSEMGFRSRTASLRGGGCVGCDAVGAAVSGRIGAPMGGRQGVSFVGPMGSNTEAAMLQGS
jgi:hypothetical protein